MRAFRSPIIWLAALACCGCNVFREMGGPGPRTADEHILEGQIALRRADYAAAKGHFDAAIALDSSKSEAYYGAAKCVLLREHINMFKLLQDFQDNDAAKLPFLSEPDSVKNQIYRANRGIDLYLSAWTLREKAGRMDGARPARQVSADYALASAIEAVLSLADFNGDGVIDSRDNLLSGIIDFNDPSKLNPDSLMSNLAAIQNDTTKIGALNGLLDKSGQLLEQSGQAIDLFLNTALGSVSDTAGSGLGCPDSLCAPANREKVGDSAIQQVKKFIGEAGSTLLIYKVDDRQDNDGDGCADEEFLDGMDNDGDGLVDEDSRGVPDSLGNTHYYALGDGADNNLDGAADDSSEAEFNRRYLASFDLRNQALHFAGVGRIFYRDSVGEGGRPLWVDTRRKVVVWDSAQSPPAADTVTTFDLCKGAVKGYHKK